MAICQCVGCLTHGACVGHWTPDYSAMEATCSAKDDLSADISPCHLHDLHPMLDQPVCSMLVYHSQEFQCRPVYILCDFLWPEVQSHSDDSHMHVIVPCSARVFGQVRPTMSYIF